MGSMVARPETYWIYVDLPTKRLEPAKIHRSSGPCFARRKVIVVGNNWWAGEFATPEIAHDAASSMYDGEIRRCKICLRRRRGV